MRKLLVLIGLLGLAAPVAAQSAFGAGVTPPVFVIPGVNGGNITPATMGVDASTCSAPGIYLKTATTTGIAFTATPSVILCVNGTAILTTTGSAVTSTVPYLAPDGAVGAPSLSFSGAPTTLGLWRSGDRMIASTNGVSRASFTTVGVLLRNTASFGFASGDPSSTDADSALERVAAGLISPSANHALGFASKAWIRTAPSSPVACTSPTVTWSNGSASFQIDVGSTCAGISTLVVTLPAVTNAYSCTATNVTTSATAAVEMTASTTTTATFTNYTRTTGVALAWVDGADVRVSCTGG